MSSYLYGRGTGVTGGRVNIGGVANLEHRCRLGHWLGSCYTGSCHIHTQAHKYEGPLSVKGRRERGREGREGEEMRERERGRGVERKQRTE